jgi:NADH-quinone oxidoreductase subunit A
MIEPATALWPLAVYAGLVVLLVVSMITLSSLLGERHRERLTDLPYESGVAPTGSARLRFHIRFYLIAMFFVIFDLEAVFVYAWAVSIRETGWTGYLEMVVFIGILAAALVYLWRIGALDWSTKQRRKEDALN